jgi:hypothetical protein
MRVPKLEKKVKPTFTPNEIKSLYDACKNELTKYLIDRDRAILSFTIISNQAHSTEGWSKQYTCSCKLLNTLEKGSLLHPARPIKQARASLALFLNTTDDEKVALRAPQ